ncbi:unnamed protein product, partial [Sphacelaria rigidula]
GHDAIEYLLDGLYARTAGSAERPVGEDELVEGACPRGGEKTGDEARGVGAPTDKQNDDTERWEEYNSGAAEKRQHAADGIDEGCDGIKNKPADGAGTEDSDGCAADLDGVSEQYPARPAKWTHQYLLTYCFIGRPSPSEDA